MHRYSFRIHSCGSYFNVPFFIMQALFSYDKRFEICCTKRNVPNNFVLRDVAIIAIRKLVKTVAIIHTSTNTNFAKLLYNFIIITNRLQSTAAIAFPNVRDFDWSSACRIYFLPAAFHNSSLHLPEGVLQYVCQVVFFSHELVSLSVIGFSTDMSSPLPHQVACSTMSVILVLCVLFNRCQRNTERRYLSISISE